MSSHHLLCTKSVLNRDQLFGKEYFLKIARLKDELFSSNLTGDVAQTDLDDRPLKIGLHNALDINRVWYREPSISNTWDEIDRYGCKYNNFYTVHPSAVNELMLQKLQDNPALRTTGLSNNPPISTLIVKLSNNWQEEWLVAQIISQGLNSHSCSSSYLIKRVLQNKGSDYGRRLLKKAEESVQESIANYSTRTIVDRYSHDLDNTSIRSVSDHIRKHVLAQK